MFDDNAMNLQNRAILRPSGNDQASSAENANENQAVLPIGGETSEQLAHQEYLPETSNLIGGTGPLTASVQQNTIMLTVSQAQPQMAPFQTAYRPANINAGPHSEIASGLPLYQLTNPKRGRKPGGQGPNRL
uniref:Uncharacterized protein n=1 Tax=Ananas comosus var. bracteatus TaxID=296719 RepID=A0A6V7QMJ7_ANACO|nr:unnamed protein product [Ananas comosus var. bracteatus]